MKKNDRLEALQILVKLLSDKVSLSHSMAAKTDLSPLSKDICFGVCRHFFRLQALADRLLEKRPKSIDVWVALLMGLYQLIYLQKPAYATVQETVALLAQAKTSWAKGLVNAVLRTFCREKEALLAEMATKDAFLWGHPQWFIKRLRNDWPEQWQQILVANDQHPPMSLRINQRHTSRDAYLQTLQQAGIEAKAHLASPQGIRLSTACDVSQLPGFRQGDVSVQDEAAQLAVSLLALQPGLKVLDACCAPGGKTCHILESESNLADFIALDVDARRLQRVAENVTRLGLQARLVEGDGLHPENWWDGQCFDRILLDAPCSATGVIRRHPDIKILRSAEDIRRICEIQKDLLNALWPLLKTGGLLVYATCSILKEENEQQIAAFLANHIDGRFIAEEKPWGQPTGHGWQLLPGENDRDGFFYSVLHKV